MADVEGMRSVRRRDIVRYGVGVVGAVGVAWSPPAIRRVRVTQVAGSPPPEPSTTVEPPVVTSFEGPFNGRRTGEVGPDPCEATDHYDIPTTLTNLGAATVVIDFCLGPDTPGVGFPILGGTFTITAGNGTLEGDVVGGRLAYLGLLTLARLTMNLSITGGTGAYSGATGTATVDGGGYVLANPITGTISGSYQLP